MSVATNRQWTDKQGQIVLVEGHLQTRSWDDKDGQTRKATEIIAEKVDFGPKAADKPISTSSSVPRSFRPSALATDQLMPLDGDEDDTGKNFVRVVEDDEIDP